ASRYSRAEDVEDVVRAHVAEILAERDVRQRGGDGDAIIRQPSESRLDVPNVEPAHEIAEDLDRGDASFRDVEPYVDLARRESLAALHVASRILAEVPRPRVVLRGLQL